MLTPVANDSNGNCCWDFSVTNPNSCTFLDTSIMFQVHTYFGSPDFLAIDPWTVSSPSSGVYNFTTSEGLMYNSVSPVFKICIEPQTGSGSIPEINVVGYKDSAHVGPNTQCATYGYYKLECRADSNCCDLLDIELRRKTQTAYHECAFDLIVRQKNSPEPCKVFGIRVKDTNGVVLHTTDSTGTPLNLDRSTVIWSGDLGDCPTSDVPGYLNKAYYTIEILDSLGAVKCSAADSFRCCYSSGISSAKEAMHDEPEAPVELAGGGVITAATVVGRKLEYSVLNKGEAIRAEMRLVSMKGSVMLDFTGELAGGMNTGELDISRLASGAYYLVVQTSRWQTSRQILVVR